MDAPRKKLDFAKPPVEEVVLSILFDSLDKLLAPHLGGIWQEFKHRGFTQIMEQPPVMPTMEAFPSENRGVQFHINVPDLPRIWFIHEDDNQIIQVQRDRFTFNWRKTKPDQGYPGFPSICGKFEGFYNHFCQIMVDMGIGKVIPLQYELTYIDQLRQGNGWNTLDELGKIYNMFVDFQEPDSFWSSAESLSLRASFTLINLRGRLHLTIRNRVKMPEEIQTLQTDFTVRGFPVNADCPTIDWFKLAREEIRKKFAMLFTENLQTQVWKRK